MALDRSKLEDTLKRRFFADSSFSIYGGVSGLYDYGPPGVAVKKNILKEWDSHFVLEDDLLEIEASQLTLEPVLQSSGHVERFTDLMVKDVKTGDCYRLDHLIKGRLEKMASAKDCGGDKVEKINLILSQLDGYTADEMDKIVRDYGLKAPSTGNELSKPLEFNLMFSTMIGPSGQIKSYLRPETAQGIFVNFKRLLEANQGKLPFGVAQIGKSFRNEISPRGGLTRMREFTMCEIEYFVDPDDKSHKKYDLVKTTVLNLHSACHQMSGESHQKMSLEAAVDKGIIANQVLAYFICRIYEFMLKIGMDANKIRFRQHMSNEMAHYATDCWDCECLTSTGWLECVGCADRSCYDLSQHSKSTKVKLSANRFLKESKEVDLATCNINKQLIGKSLRGDSKEVIEVLSNAGQEEISAWEKELVDGVINLKIGDKTFPLDNNMITIERQKKVLKVEEIIPNVIEPSFGVDRIFHSLLEHNFKVRDGDGNRTYFTFPASIAPIKCSILPLSNNEEFMSHVDKISSALKKEGVRPKVDASGESIGKRYARTDEIGIPFGVTIDFDTLKFNTVTLRFCTTTEQIRVDIDALPLLVRNLIECKSDWSEAKKLWPAFMGQS